MKICCFKDFRQPEYLLRRTDCHRIRWGTNRCNCRPCFDTKPCDRKHLAGYIHRRLRYKNESSNLFSSQKSAFHKSLTDTFRFAVTFETGFAFAYVMSR